MCCPIRITFDLPTPVPIENLLQSLAALSAEYTRFSQGAILCITSIRTEGNHFSIELVSPDNDSTLGLFALSLQYLYKSLTSGENSFSILPSGEQARNMGNFLMPLIGDMEGVRFKIEIRPSEAK